MARSLARSFVSPALLVLLSAVACGSVRKRHPLPKELADEAVIPGIPDARYWGDKSWIHARNLVAMSKEDLQKNYAGTFGVPHNYLAISGGGSNGAYGAGLLCGWSARGDRPKFTIVTGISTGALTAPFAFLGSGYDARLKEVFTSYSTKDLIRERSLLAAVTGDSFSDTAPLARLIERYMTQDMLDKIAAEHRTGRRLWIATTHLDAERPVIWDIGRIANSGAPNRLEIFRKVLLASASIPIAFPPVSFEVEARGQRYDELHVDGGATAQVFLYPLGLDWHRVWARLEVPGKPGVYLIRNAWLSPRWSTTDPADLFGIATRTTDSLIRSQGIGDLYRIYLGTKRDGLEFHMSSIPEDFDHETKEAFDREYMRALFERGYERARNGYPWLRYPPGVDPEHDE